MISCFRSLFPEVLSFAPVCSCLCVYVYVCVFVFFCLFVFVRVCVRVTVCDSVCVHMCMSTLALVYLFVCRYSELSVAETCVCWFVSRLICTFAVFGSC